MTRSPVSSAALLSVGYDPETQTLEVELTSRAIYSYTGVPQTVFDDLMAAPSVGKYFASHVRNQYPASRAA